MRISKKLGVRAGTAAIVAGSMASLIGAGSAAAWGPGSAEAPPVGFRSQAVDGAGMPAVTVRSWASTSSDPATSPTVVFLDGLRATWDVSGWERDANVAYLSQHGVNVVMPVGGTGSFYTDWYNPSSLNGQAYTYKWGTWLTSTLPNYLRSLGFSDNASLVGLSMGGSAAMINAANSGGYYKRAASLSGYNNPSAPGMPVAIRIAMLDAGGWNSDNMWGFPTDSKWTENDPTVNVERFRNIPLWISAGNGAFGSYNPNPSPADIIQGVPLEVLALSQSHAFKDAADAAGVTNVHYDFPAAGTHTWGYWQDQVWKMLEAGFFTS